MPVPGEQAASAAPPDPPLLPFPVAVADPAAPPPIAVVNPVKLVFDPLLDVPSGTEDVPPVPPAPIVAV